MAYWNHFAESNYSRVKFGDLKVGDKFRNDFFKNGRRRPVVICIKTSKTTFIEQKSKKEHKLFSADSYEVYSFSKNEFKIPDLRT